MSFAARADTIACGCGVCQRMCGLGVCVKGCVVQGGVEGGGG